VRDAYEEAVDKIELDLIEEIEHRTKHDVKAKIEAFCKIASGLLFFYLQVIKTFLNSYDLVHANFGLTAPYALVQPHRPLVLTLWRSDRGFPLGDNRTLGSAKILLV
jgi:hypothetical protein